MKKFDSILEKISTTKQYLETKIDAINMLEDKFNKNKEDVKKVQDLFIKSKTEFQQQVADVKIDMAKYSTKHETHEQRMD